MLDTLIRRKVIFVINNTVKIIIFTNIEKKLMQDKSKNYDFCIKVAIDNAKKRISLLDNKDKISVLEEYKEWINDGLNNHNVLLLREDPII